MKKSIFLFLLLVYGLSYSQYVDIVEKGKAENLTPKEFIIPLKNIENYQFVFVARYKAYYPCIPYC
ncbi:hypothetical protein RAH57_17270 [Chryseobacterium sp. CKR4-1]|uniref:hypothetical protein n=1 Tax=Chryseobacterium sp. CKR4-1 TaxID=3068896 RepID=UPI0027969776|nr:hypothetical protein [Chryseobacterium sp. CKR4-1]MDQ1805745.1 hypothetical protein [Chryseobacterium sp. CKR4-1]